MKYGIGHVIADEDLNSVIERRRKEHCLVVAAHGAHDRLDLGEETEIGHFVSFVDHQDCEPVEEDCLPFEQIDQSSRCGDHDFDAATHGRGLVAYRSSSIHGKHAFADCLAKGLENRCHLVGELTGRHDHQAMRTSRFGLEDPLQHWKPESQGLPRPGLGLAADVSPGQGIRNRERLDRKWRLDAILLQFLDELGIYTEIGKSRDFRHQTPNS